MEIRRSTLDADAELGRDRGDSLLADKIAKLHIFFSLLKPNISDEERNYLDTALVECYKRFSITHDNASLYDADGNFKQMPSRLSATSAARVCFVPGITASAWCSNPHSLNMRQ